MQAESAQDQARPTDLADPAQVQPSFWLCVVKENGHFYVYDLATLRLAFHCKKLNQLPELAKWEPHGLAEGAEPESALHTDSYLQAQEGQLQTDNVAVKPEDVIVELQVHGLGPNRSRPVVSLLVDDTVVFYEMFPFDEQTKGGDYAFSFFISYRLLQAR